MDITKQPNPDPQNPYLIEAKSKLADLITTYEKLNEEEKFQLAKIFNTETGGKLSPYNSPEPVALALVPTYNPFTNQIKIIAGRRNIEPCAGQIALPGGYVEHHEQPDMAAARELYEETGIFLNPDNFEPFYTPRTSKSNCTIIFMLYQEIIPFTVEELNDILNASDSTETIDMHLIGPNTELAFEIHTKANNFFFDNINHFCDNMKILKEYKPFDISFPTKLKV